jgi:DMSO/TMAO reductase YedYZ molybdopterin-dependent catalytic subunit
MTFPRRLRLLTAALVTGAVFALHLLVRRVPYPPNAAAQWIIRVFPAGLTTRAIDLLGHWAMRLLAGVTTAIFVVGLASLLSFTRRTPAPAADQGRRRVVRALAFGAAAIVVGAAAIVRSLPRMASELGGRLLSLGPVRGAAYPPQTPADAAIAAVPGITPELTANRSFYVVDESLDDPDIDASRWRLRIHGAVATALAVGYEDLLAMPAVEQYVTLECISNRVAGRLMSTALWRGVPLADLLRRAGVDNGRAVKVVTRAVGGYATDLPIARALDPRTLIAYGMNGRTLPRSHGFPARIITPGLYGMKNCKWLSEIEVVTHDAFGYWEERGWSDRAVVRTMSRIDTPFDNARVPPGTTLAGAAFAGDRGIARVEITVDGGRTWKPARLGRALASTTWRQWAYTLPVETKGELDVLVRAIDGRGMVQDSEFRSPHPSGASGLHRIALTVEGS